MKPIVEVIALGGTIASVPQPDGQGVVPSLGAEELLRTVPSAAEIADIRVRTLAKVPSTEISFEIILELLDLIEKLESGGVAGVVITQGTDTIEETSYLLDLLHHGECPVVVTGAMRNPTLPGADGPANLLMAISIAADPVFRGQGVLVAFDDLCHAAAWVQKRDTSRVSAFWSPSPLGWMVEGRAVLRVRAPRRPHLARPSGGKLPFVPILKQGFADEPRLIDAAMASGAAAIVAELAGGGHAMVSWADALQQAAKSIPVIFSSRTRGGRILSKTYGQLGAEMDLIRRGLVPAGDLDAVKARLLMAILIATDKTSHFSEYADLSWRGRT
ncbi:MAG: asparaginase [Paracoccaceae bacterium]|nr:asparaginase [Paracoccaceae bacterium]